MVEISILIYYGIGFLLGVIFSFIIWKLFSNKKIEREVGDARVRLRNIYSKYQNELHDVITKIDEMLGALGTDER